MNPLLDDASVAAGILAITRSGGAKAVTARSLAAHLHVSLGALYNYITSMPDAMQNADRNVYRTIEAVIGSASDVPAQRKALQEWGQNELPLLDLITDLSRPHAPLPTSFLHLLSTPTNDFPQTQQAAEIARSFAGLWRAGSPDLTGQEVEMLAELLSQGIATHDPAADFSAEAMPIDSLHQLALEFIATRPHDRIEDQVRAASVDVLLEETWSFRRLQNKTGYPLARLNRMSSRDDHVMVAVGDIISGIVTHHLVNDRSVVELLRIIISTAGANPNLLIGAQLPFLSLSVANQLINDSGLWATSGLDPHQVMLACGLCTAVLHAGYSNRETDPESAAASVPLAIAIAERRYNQLISS